jgi:hypothetical protein
MSNTFDRSSASAGSSKSKSNVPSPEPRARRCDSRLCRLLPLPCANSTAPARRDGQRRKPTARRGISTCGRPAVRRLWCEASPAGRRSGAPGGALLRSDHLRVLGLTEVLVPLADRAQPPGICTHTISSSWLPMPARCPAALPHGEHEASRARSQQRAARRYHPWRARRRRRSPRPVRESGTTGSAEPGASSGASCCSTWPARPR